MRVLFLNLLMEADGLGGAEKSLLLLLENIDKKRFQPVLATNMAGKLSESASGSGCEVFIFNAEKEALTIYRDTFNLNPFTLLSKFAKLKGTIKELSSFVKREKIDLIYTNNIRSHILGVFLAKKTGRILVWHFRDILFGKMRTLFKILGNLYPDKIIAVSQAVADNFSPLEKITVVYNGIDDKLEPAGPLVDIRAELGLGQDTPLVVLIGRLTRLKRQDVLIRAAARVKTSHPRVRFLLVGDMAFERNKNFENELLTLRNELDLRDEIIFTGFRDDIQGWLKDVSILTLISEHEAFPRVILEAMAAQIPVIATRVGGTPEIVVDSETGFLIGVGDDQALAEKIIWLLDNKKLALEMGLKGRQRVSEKFRLTDNVKKIENLLEELTGNI